MSMSMFGVASDVLDTEDFYAFECDLEGRANLLNVEGPGRVVKDDGDEHG